MGSDAEGDRGEEGDDRLGKVKLVKIMRWVADQYDVHGRTTAISDEEMEQLVREHLPDHYATVRRGRAR